jgi:putative two-component system response regulator
MVNPSDIFNSRILIADDQEKDIQQITHILQDAGHVSIDTTMNPHDVAELHRKNRYDLILLALKMAGMDGFQVMAHLKKTETGGYIPVLAITTGHDQKLRALQSGAKDFISKPFEAEELQVRIYNMLKVRLLYKELHKDKCVLEKRVQERTDDLKGSYREMVLTMTRAAEYKDEDTGDHLERISDYCRELALKLGLDQDFRHTIFFASPMHDIGKIGVPDNILLKPGGFTPGEWEIMKGHAALGGKILGQSKSPYLRMGAEIALSHHERWDGGGYPNGLKGEKIPLSARIMNICDIYDALRSKRPYKPVFDHLKSVDIITKGDGHTRPEYFDPVILEAFKQNHELFRDIFEAYRGQRR